VGRTSDARERLIGTAQELMLDKGYAAVGVGEICAQAGVNKGSFYHFFESKQRLGIAAIDAYWGALRPIWSATLAGDAPPLQRIERLLTMFYEHNRAERDSRGKICGCMLGNLALEQSTQDADVQRRLAQIFDEQAAMLESVLREAKKAGDVPGDTKAKKAARSLLALLEGSVMLAKLHNDPTLLRDIPAQARRLLGA
jgi:TetR/AcrR family transcriptional repressor of nem operon